MKAVEKVDTTKGAVGAVIGSAPAEAVPERRPIKNSDFGILDYNCNRWWAVLELADYEAAKTDAKMWSNLSGRLSVYDIVEIRTRGGELTADWVVAENHGPAGNYIRFAEKSKTVLSEHAFDAVRATGDWYVVHLGPRRWVVVSPEGRVIRDGMLSREAAEYEMRTRRGDMAAPRHPIMG